MSPTGLTGATASRPGGRTTQLSAARHVPRLALDWALDTPHEQWRRVDGAMVFADISGFTALSERLAGRGRIGAEELVETLSRVFGGMLDIAAERGGELLKFGGDALFFLFDRDDAAVQAACAAVEMRAELRRAQEIVTSVGRLSLSVSIGVHAGALDCFLVGHPHRELVALGPGVTAVIRAENAASAGEIVLSRQAAEVLPAGAVRPRVDGELLLRWRRAPVPAIGRSPERPAHDEVASRLLPELLLDSFDGTRPDPAHRVGTISFMKFAGTDAILAEGGPRVLGDGLHRTLSIAQEAFAAEDVALLCVDADADGGKLFASSGVPLTSEDDEGRMLRAAHEIVAAKPPLPLHIGINRGHVFVAEVGTAARAGFSAMGDTTNTAARICAKAGPGEILVHSDVLASARARYESEPVGPFTMKGKRLPLTLYRLGAELGRRESDDPRTAPLVGRRSEFERLMGVVGRLGAGQGGTAEVTGPVGAGKSRLVREALKGLADDATLRVHAEPYGAANAFRIFRDPLRALLGIERGRQEEMAEALRRAVTAVAPQHESRLALVGDVLQISVEQSEEVRDLLPQHRLDRTADVVIDLLAATHPRGLVLVVEDAHWADAASAQVITRIARETASRPWVVVTARRDHGEGVRLDDVTERIELGPLPADSIRALAIELTEAAPLREHELGQVVERADGNPLFATELIRAAQELGSLEAVPTSLQGAIAAQVDVLDPPTKRALSYASVLGRSFRRQVFFALMEREDLTVDDATVAHLSRFLEAGEEERLRFRNGLLCDVVYDGLGYNLRSRLHRGAGEVVERISTDVRSDAEYLALHFSRAGVHARAYHHSCVAAERWELAHASAAAAAQLQQAVESARHVEGVTRAGMRDLWVRLGTARDQAGLLEEALDALRRAGRLPADAVADGELLLRRAQVRERMGSFSAALGESTQARRRIAHLETPEAQSLRARLLAFAATIRMRQERAPAARDLAHQAIAAGEACGAETAIARACGVLSWAEVVFGNPAAAMSNGYRALELFDRVGDDFGLAEMANNLGSVTYYEGDWERSVELYRQGMDADRRVGNVTGAHLSAANVGEVLVNQGHLAEAEPLLVEAARTLRASGHLWGAVFAEMHLGRLLVWRGELGQAERLLRRCVEENRRMGSGEWVYEAAVHLGGCLVAAGRPQEALDVIADAAVEGRSLFDAAAAGVRALALEELGRTDDAADAVRDGLGVARERALEFDLAWLLIVADRLGLTDVSEERAPAEEARRLFRRLGVRARPAAR